MTSIRRAPGAACCVLALLAGTTAAVPVAAAAEPETRTVLDIGHLDIKTVAGASSLDVVVHYEGEEPPGAYDPDEVVLYAAPGSETTVPAGDDYAFLGEAGDPVWVLPQTARDDLLWPGWNLDLGNSGATAVTWTLESLTAPGELAIYTSGLGGADIKLDSDDPDHRAFSYRTHGHANWAFSAEGVYCLHSRFDTVPADPARTATATVVVAVGDLDPAQVHTSDCGKPADQVGQPDPFAITEQPDDATTPAGSPTTFAVAATGGSLTYRWQRLAPHTTSWEDVPGANSAGLTTRPVSVASSGERFRVIVTDADPLDPEQAGAISEPATLTVTPAAATVALALPTSLTHGDQVDATITVAAPEGVAVTGTVAVARGKRVLATGSATGRSTVLPLTLDVPGGRQKLTVTYSGGADLQPAAAQEPVTVSKATAVVKVKPVMSRVGRGKTARFRVAVSAPGATPRGRVTVKIGGARKTTRLTSKGKATVGIKLSPRAAPGTKVVKVSYAGDRNVAKGKTSTRIRVTR